MSYPLFLTAMIVMGTASAVVVGYWLRGLVFMAVVLALVTWVKKVIKEEA